MQNANGGQAMNGHRNFPPEIQRLVDQGLTPQQIMAMVQRGGMPIQQSHLPQQQPMAGLPSSSFMPPQAPQQFMNPQAFMNQPQPADNLAFDGQANNAFGSSSFSLDSASAAKQMAALNAMGRQRAASQTGGNFPTLGQQRPASSSGLNPASAIPRTQTVPAGPIPGVVGGPPPLGDATRQQQMPSVQQPQAAQQAKNRRVGFLTAISDTMVRNGTPLPTAITGIPSPTYDPETSQFRQVEPSSEPGGFKLAGKDIDLFKLWGLVFPQGGSAKVTQESKWPLLLPHFDLPETTIHAGITTPTAALLAQYFSLLLGPFEIEYMKNLQKMMLQKQISGQGAMLPPGMHPGATQVAGGQSQQLQSQLQQPAGISQYTMPVQQPFNLQPPVPAFQRAASNTLPQAQTQQAPAVPAQSISAPPDIPAIDPSDPLGLKRKNGTHDERDGKRIKTDGITSTTQEISRASAPPASADQPSFPPPSVEAAQKLPSPAKRGPPMRQKIEYMPLRRELETYGGRDLDAIEAELRKQRERRPMRAVDEYGTVDIEALTMSLQSGLAPEVSWALTALTVMSIMRGQQEGTGFPLQLCEDLLDVLADVLEETAFGSITGEQPEPILEEPTPLKPIRTHKELVRLIHDDGELTFAGLEKDRQAPTVGPGLRPGDIILSIMGILRNLSMTMDNQLALAARTRILDLIMRLCDLDRSSQDPVPASSSISLTDLLAIRKDALHLVANLAPTTKLSAFLPQTSRRIFELVVSFVSDPSTSTSPALFVSSLGLDVNKALFPPQAQPLPMPSTDVALECFSRLFQPDVNRQLLSTIIPKDSLYSLLMSLLRMLPLTEEDHAVCTNEAWLGYLERVVLSIYNITFLAPPPLKRRIKRNRTFSVSLIRIVQRYAVFPADTIRNAYAVICRRAVEALRMVDDDEEDSFGEPKAAPFSFGMGYDESDSKGPATGTGILAGQRGNDMWNTLCAPGLDETTFSELESLLRVDVRA